MGRAPCCSKIGLHRGPWTPREDTLLTKYIQSHGEGHWRSLPKKAGLLRCGKSCRLRWMNYLRPDIKRGNITPDEDDLIIRLHSLLGNRWSLIAGRLPGRTDNEIKNYWNTHLSKRLRRSSTQGTDPEDTHMNKLPEQDGSRKRRNISNRNNGNKKQSGNNKSKPAAEPTEKHKVHLPKPTRVTSYSLLRNESFASSGLTQGGFGTQVSEEEAAIPCYGFKDGNNNDDDNGAAAGFLVGGGDDDRHHHHHYDLVDGSDFECQSQVFTSEHSLEKLYEEYLQILKNDDDEQVKLDSFAESLLI